MEKRNIFVVYFFILMATCLDNLNSATAFTLQGNIQQAFNTDSSTASWVLSGYALTLGSFIMVSGKISDIIGPHNLYLGGLSVIWICALICACIPHSSIITLIVFRAIQGVGASALVPSTLALAANYFSGPYAKYLPGAVVGFILALTGIFGVALVLGGAFSETAIGYKSYFYFVFAYGLVMNIILLFLIIPIEETEEHKKMKLKNVDFIGSALTIIGILLMILGLTEGGDDWKRPRAYVPLVVGFFTFVSSFIFEMFYLKRFQEKNQHRDKSEDWRLQIDLIFPPEIIHIPNFLPILIACGMYFATFTMITAIGVLYYSSIDGDSPIIVALKVAAISAGVIFGATTYRQSYYGKIGVRNMFIISAAVSLGTCIWFSRTNFHSHKSYWKFGFVSLFLYGYALNVFFNIYIGVVVSNTPLHLQGVVNGVYQTCSQVCLSVGNALVPSIVGNVVPATSEEMKQHLHNKFQNIFYVLMGFHVVILIMMVLFVRAPKKSEESETAEATAEEKPVDVEMGCDGTCSEKEEEGSCTNISLHGDISTSS
ncbi:hypothetical protein PICMEDRAFT_13883 [Pichia membranifaciens NRRL Y-2026]|uniref:Major facilitator superfamily (MFS) profile domain-containing protein n=1 Tax=Pichia membranifaciens NRRL Y-2026 TaxID=763406 RepID=A0A1E3NDC6_9ASCO|nr:hypothetical protein PICMEDRAFT_13883 [Pichia membranifaciens NRRL Y-2026]ODQ44131.1 hypothetical protein PICMEDRAFT_13883 [Pichia membranifaciens NRRL Y-2026]